MNKQWYQLIKSWPILLLGLLCSFSAQASSIFGPPPTDESVQILGIIFGPNIGHVALGGQANPGLSQMFEIFNMIAVTIGIIIVSYIGIVSILNTAQEGKAMGKKWAGIWIPLRSVLGMALLVPTPGSGYSVIQVGVMWIVMQGIGAADYVWSAVLDNFLQNNNSALTGIRYEDNNIQITAMRNHAHTITEQLLNSAACAASFNKIISQARKEERPWISQSVIRAYRDLKIYSVESANNIDNPDGAVFAGGVFIGIKGDERLYNVCGHYEVSGKVYKNEWPASLRGDITPTIMKEKAREIYQQKVNALLLMYSSISQAATELINGRHIYYGYKNLAEKIYINSLTSVTIPAEVSGQLYDKIHAGKLAGWINAGPFYFSLSKANQSEFFRSTSDPSDLEGKNIPHCKNPHCEELEDNTENVNLLTLDKVLEYSDEKVLFKKALYEAYKFFQSDNHTFKHEMAHNEIFEESFMKEMQRQMDNDRTGDFKKIFKSIVNDDDGIINRSEINNLMASLKNSDRDPLYILGRLGNQILSATEKNLLQSIKDPDKFLKEIKAIVTGENDDEINKIEHNMFLTTITLAFFITLWGAGASLALYIPFIPFMIYSVTSIGWLILVIEAIVAGPLLALSFVLPSGDELGKVAQGLMILLNIFLRPVLILFGFVLASRLFKAVFTFIHYGLSTYYNETVDHSTTILSSLAILIMYIVFIVSLTNKSFALIYMLPDKILRWIGGGAEQTDISQETQMTKGSLQRTGEITQKLASASSIEELEHKRKFMEQHNPTTRDD